jgi:hypothetical protein
MEEIEEDLRKEQYSEEYEMNYQYERSVCWWKTEK